MSGQAADLMTLVNAGLLDAARHSANGLFWFPTPGDLHHHFRMLACAERPAV